MCQQPKTVFFDQCARNRFLAPYLLPTAVNCVYVATDFWVTRSRWSVLADVVGLPAFLVGFWLVCELVRVGQCRALTTDPSRSQLASSGDWPADGGRPCIHPRGY